MVRRKEKNNDAKKKRDCAQVVEQQQVSVLEDKKVTSTHNEHGTVAFNADDGGCDKDDDTPPLRASKRCTPPSMSERSVRQSLSRQLRISSPTPPSKSSSIATVVSAATATTTATVASTSLCQSGGIDFLNTPTAERNSQQQPLTAVPDLESAIHHVVDIGKDTREYLSVDKGGEWVTFRVGDAGDATMIASWYRKSRDASSSDSPTNRQTAEMASPVNSSVNLPPASCATTGGESQSSTDDNKKPISTALSSTSPSSGGQDEGASSMELWLADSLGDEDTPPAVHALMAYVSSPSPTEDDSTDVAAQRETTLTVLGGVALMTMELDDRERILRIEWFRVDPTLSHADVLERKMWFRLSCIAMVTTCLRLVVDEACSISRYE